MAPWAKTVVGLVLGVVVGGPVSGLVMGATARILIRQRLDELRRSTDLTPVLVAARDLQPLHRITLHDLSQRSVPKQLVTSSVVMPDSASYVLSARLAVPLRAGDMLQWSYLAMPGGGLTKDDRDIFEGCVDAMGTSPTAPKLESSSAEVRARLAAEVP